METLNTRIKSKTDTTANWNANSSFIPLKGEIIIYSDYKTVNNVICAGIKIGDGKAYLIDLPFVGDNIISDLNAHINNITYHVSAADREKWDNKVSCFWSDGNLVFENNN